MPLALPASAHEIGNQYGKKIYLEISSPMDYNNCSMVGLYECIQWHNMATSNNIRISHAY